MIDGARGFCEATDGAVRRLLVRGRPNAANRRRAFRQAGQPGRKAGLRPFVTARITLRENTLTMTATPGGTTATGAVALPSGPPATGTVTAGSDREMGDRRLIDSHVSDFLKDGAPDLVFFFGYGDGRYARTLRDQCAAPVIVYEPRPEVLAALESGAAAPPAGFTVVGTLAAVRAHAAANTNLLSSRLLAGAIPAWRDAHPDAFDRFVEAVRQSRVDAEIRSVTAGRSAATWLRHLASNLPQVAAMPPLDLLTDRFAGWTGILVGAGPSLDRNIEELRLAQDRALICTVSTALPALARAGVVPHLVVVIEGKDLGYHFADVPHLDRVTLLPSPLSHPSHFAVPVGHRLAIAPQGTVAGDWLHRALGRRQLESGGSVACAAFAALHQLGCDPLVLVGMDLALTEGRTHAGGTDQASRRFRYEPEAGRVYHWYPDGKRTVSGHWQASNTPAWGGQGQVLTRPVFNSYRQWFEDAAETWARDRTLVNATEGGARIHGFAESTLAEWRRAPANGPRDARQVIDLAIASAPPGDAAPLWRQVAAELAVIEEAATAAGEADRLAARALRDLQSRRYGGLDALLARLAAAETRLREHTRSTRLLNALVGERSKAMAREDAPPAGASSAVATAWSLRQSRRISGLVVDGARELVELFGPLAARAAAEAAATPRTNGAGVATGAVACAAESRDPVVSPSSA